MPLITSELICIYSINEIIYTPRKYLNFGNEIKKVNDADFTGRQIVVGLCQKRITDERKWATTLLWLRYRNQLSKKHIQRCSREFNRQELTFNLTQSWMKLSIVLGYYDVWFLEVPLGMGSKLLFALDSLQTYKQRKYDGWRSSLFLCYVCCPATHYMVEGPNRRAMIFAWLQWYWLGCDILKWG